MLRKKKLADTIFKSDCVLFCFNIAMAEGFDDRECVTSGFKNSINHKAEEKVFLASEEKTKGNTFFQQKEIKKAVACYHR